MTTKIVLGLALLNFAALQPWAHESLWLVPSSNHEQTFAYGSERHNQWVNRHGHLALVIEFTNDPYVDRINPRQYDDFEFEFPSIRLGADHQTFYYYPPHRDRVAVAVNKGILRGIILVPTSSMTIQKVHGMVTIFLMVRPTGN